MSTALLVVVLVSAFITGAMLAVIALVSYAIRREEKYLTLYGAAPGVVSRGARRLNGIWLRPEQDPPLYLR